MVPLRCTRRTISYIVSVRDYLCARAAFLVAFVRSLSKVLWECSQVQTLLILSTMISFSRTLCDPLTLFLSPLTFPNLPWSVFCRGSNFPVQLYIYRFLRTIFSSHIISDGT